MINRLSMLLMSQMWVAFVMLIPTVIVMQSMVGVEDVRKEVKLEAAASCTPEVISPCLYPVFFYSDIAAMAWNKGIRPYDHPLWLVMFGAVELLFVFFVISFMRITDESNPRPG